MKTLIAVLAIATTLASFSVNAGTPWPKQMKKIQCHKNTTAAKVYCAAYISGVLDTIILSDDETMNEYYTCFKTRKIPTNRRVVANVVRQFAANDPWHMGQSIISRLTTAQLIGSAVYHKWCA